MRKLKYTEVTYIDPRRKPVKQKRMEQLMKYYLWGATLSEPVATYLDGFVNGLSEMDRKILEMKFSYHSITYRQIAKELGLYGGEVLTSLTEMMRTLCQVDELSEAIG